ncbi:MAG: hypothetical protein E6Z21_01105 [Anaerococcus vaginalis]|nr:hypothetical protein [Anaerococcus vaginalis]
MKVEKNIPITLEFGERKVKVVENDDSTVTFEIFPKEEGENFKKLLMHPDGTFEELD